LDEPRQALQRGRDKVYLEYQTLDLSIRKYGQEVFVEARGPNGEWAEAVTSIDFEEVRLKRSDTDSLGDILGKGLMPSQILQLYQATFQRITNRSNQGLRLRLHFLGDTRTYASLAWETVKINGRTITMDPHQAIVRAVDLSEPATPLAVEKPPYRILVISENPTNAEHYGLSVVEIVDAVQIKEALSPLIDSHLIQVETLNNATVAQVEEMLKTREFHIFHFTGYTVVSSSHRDSALFFTDKDGEVQIVTSQHLGNVLFGTGVRMAILNGCDTAYGGRLGAAEVLLQAGLPIVVAHNGKISIRAANMFVQTFYEALTRHNSLEQAILAGRIAIESISPYEWACPVLFTRTLDGKLWVGEAGYKIETFLKDGRLIAEPKKQGEFDANVFANRLETALNNIRLIDTQDDRLKAQQLIAEVQDAIVNLELDQASQKLSEVTTHIYLTVSQQEES
jgi:CHAT domain